MVLLYHSSLISFRCHEMTFPLRDNRNQVVCRKVRHVTTCVVVSYRSNYQTSFHASRIKSSRTKDRIKNIIAVNCVTRFCLSHSVIMLRPKYFDPSTSVADSFQVTQFSNDFQWKQDNSVIIFLALVIARDGYRLEECKGANLIASRLSYNLIASELISVPIAYASQTSTKVTRDGNLSFPTKSRVS